MKIVCHQSFFKISLRNSTSALNHGRHAKSTRWDPAVHVQLLLHLHLLLLINNKAFINYDKLKYLLL